MRFKPRLSADGIYENHFYYADNPLYQIGYGLPNCTCYAWGRFCEIQGKLDYHIPTSNGGKWFPEVVAKGYYTTGSKPKLGAIACFYNPNTPGHVAIVEKIYANGDFLISQSGYHRPIAPYPPDTPNYFWTNRCDGLTKLAPWMGSGYTCQGFVYLPGDQPTPGGKLPIWMLKKIQENNFQGGII